MPAIITEPIVTVAKPATSIFGRISSKINFLSSSVFPLAFATSFDNINVPGKPKSAVVPIAIAIGTDILNIFAAIMEKIIIPNEPRNSVATNGNNRPIRISGVVFASEPKITAIKATMPRPNAFAYVIISGSKNPIALAATPTNRHITYLWITPPVKSASLNAMNAVIANFANKI